MIQDRAMLINLSVQQWTARRHDAAASKEIAKAHGAANAGRFNKLLIDTEFLKPISAATSKLRDYHYEHTLPWADDGRRLLPSQMYFTYTSAMRDLRDKFNEAVNDFVVKYPQLVQAERKRLGSLYRPEDYPQDIRARFGVTISPEPVPAANDFRVDIGDDIAKVRQEIEAETAERTKRALADSWNRVREVVTHVHDRLSDKDAIFRDSLIENVSSLIDVLGALNFTNDPGLEAARTAMQDLIKSPVSLRTNMKLREDVARRAAEIISSLPV